MMAYLPLLLLLAHSSGGSFAIQPVGLAAPGIVANDRFGNSVALDSKTLVIGAIGDDAGGADAGSVYVYARSGLGWKLEGKLAPQDIQPGDWFGCSCALLGDTLVVGAKRSDAKAGDAGAVYVFERHEDTWMQTARLTASDASPGAMFGHDVDLAQNRLVIGAWGDGALGVRTGAAYVFGRRGSAHSEWKEEAKLTASDGAAQDDFGRAVSIEASRIVIGKPGGQTNGRNSGAAYVFDLIGAGWIEVAKLLPLDGAKSDHFGTSVSLSGNAVLVGAPANDDAGVSSGAAYLFRREDDTWNQVAKLLPADGHPGAQFGMTVGILRDRVLVGASNDSRIVSGAGAVYEFIRGYGGWFEANKFSAQSPAPMDSFGLDLALGEEGFVAGAQNRDEFGENSGSVYLLELGDLFVGHSGQASRN